MGFAEGGNIMVVAGTTPNMGRMAHDFSKNPMLVYWEMTQACGLACKHCRAEAMPQPPDHRQHKNLLMPRLFKPAFPGGAFREL